MATSVTDARISDKGRVELQISVPPTDVASLLDECENELARDGGIIPDGQRSTLVARYGEERLKKLTQEWLMDRIGIETFGASDTPLVGFPQFILIEDGYPEGPFVFQAVTYELPKGELSSAEPVELGPSARIPSDESVDKALKSLIRAYTAQRVSNDDRPIQLGDTAKVDIEVSAGGVPVTTFSKKSSAFKVDYSSMPSSFVDQVVGMRPGDVKEFTFTVPAIEGVCDEETFDAKVTVEALYYVDEPKLTAKWIKSKFPGLETEEDLRRAMAQNLTQRAYGMPSKEDAIDEALFDRLSTDIPDELVDFVVEGVERAEAKRMHDQGFGLEEYCAANDTTPEEFKAKLRKTAIRDIKLSIALDALYTAKEFTLSESDLDMFFDHMAPGRGAEMRYGYTMSGRLYLAEEMAQRGKARRWLSETAKLARR
ncbi:MAG: hypothetical protein IKF56_08170 [Eggerthellaceae bacterium]|nr:hypothetical protein [Eggerthellaceae bacterium]